MPQLWIGGERIFHNTDNGNGSISVLKEGLRDMQYFQTLCASSQRLETEPVFPSLTRGRDRGARFLKNRISGFKMVNGFI